MSEVVTCPSREVLEEFLLGHEVDVDADSLERHLATCPACQVSLAGVAADDDLVRAMKRDDPLGSEAASGTDSEGARTNLTQLVKLLVPVFRDIPNGMAGTIVREGHRESNLSMEATVTQSPDGGAGSVEIGTALGRFEIRSVLGEGGMGVVLEAWDPLLERKVAIKVPHQHLLARMGAGERLIQEARAAAAVVDDHIVPIHSVEDAEGTPYLVMPLLSGKTLKERLEETEETLPVREILRIGREAATGLAAAHRQGLLHCDIKPGNLWLEAPTDRVKVLDFGLALPRERDGELARGGSGTPGYLAPEQVRMEPLDPRTDVFALGCVLYLMAAGRLPYLGPARIKSLWTLVGDPPLPVRELNPELPARLGELIDGMIQRDADERPPDCAVVRQILEDIEQAIAETSARRSRQRWGWGVVGAACLGGLLVAAWWALFGPDGPETVLMTFEMQAEPREVVLLRDGREQTILPGKKSSLLLEPGVYQTKTGAGLPGWLVVPSEITVKSREPQALRLSVVGELASKSAHTESATGCVFASTADKVRVVSVGQDRRLARWTINDSGAVEWADLPHAARCVAVSPDHRFVVTAGGNRQSPTGLELFLWDADKLEEVGMWSGPERLTQALAWSPFRGQVASVDADGVRLWEVETGQSQMLSSADAGQFHALAWTADGTHLVAVGEMGRVLVWDVTSEEVKSPRGLVCGAGALQGVVCFDHDAMTVGEEGKIWRCSFSTDTVTMLAEGAAGARAIAMTSDGSRVLTGNAAGTIDVWSVEQKARRCTLPGHQGAVTGLAVEPVTDRVVSTGSDGTVRMWRIPPP